MRKLSQIAITPDAVIRFVVLVALANYYAITSAPAARSITSFWNEAFPIVGRFSETILPMLFIAAMFVVIVFYRYRAYAAIMVSLIPVAIYAALSAGWYIGDYPSLNFAAIGTHSTVVLLFLAIVWREVYVPPTSTD